jgi:hypothetical protein
LRDKGYEVPDGRIEVGHREFDAIAAHEDRCGAGEFLEPCVAETR